MAILKKKAEAEAVPLPDNVAIYIAGKIKSNVRELEGSLIRLVAYASLTGQQITLPLAQEVLKNVLGHDEKAVTIDIIQKFVADFYKLKVADLKSRNNAKSVTIPRQVAMYLCKALTHASLPEIGRSFGGKHHSTVIHSVRKVEAQRKTRFALQQRHQHPARGIPLAVRAVFHRHPQLRPVGRRVRSRPSCRFPQPGAGRATRFSTGSRHTVSSRRRRTKARRNTFQQDLFSV